MELFTTLSPTLSALTVSILLCSLMVISSNSAVTSVVYLIFTFVLVALYLCSLGLQYLGLTYVIIYVGAIIVLLLFVIIMINLNHYGDINSSSNTFTPSIAVIVVASLIYGYIIVKGSGALDSIGHSSIDHQSKSFFQLINQLIFSGSELGDLSVLSPDKYLDYFSNWSQSSLFLSGSQSQIQSIALELYTHQAIWLIIISLVLMISIIGPIVICRMK